MKKHTQKNIIPWDPDAYDRYNKLQQEFALKMLQKCRILGYEQILDVGSGSGNITALLAKKVPQGHVVGIDSSLEMIHYATKQYQAIPNLRFLHANAEDFNLDEKFDLITSFTVFHWIEAQEKALRNCYNHLKPSALFLLGMTVPFDVNNVLNECCLGLIDGKWHSELKDFKPPYYIENLTMHDYKKMLKKIGFKIVTFDFTITKFAFKDHQDFANWFFSWMLHYRVILGDEKARLFFLDLAHAYTTLTNNFSNQNVYYEFCAWEILLKR